MGKENPPLKTCSMKMMGRVFRPFFHVLGLDSGIHGKSGFFGING
jgi:hypothetical protein